MNKRPVVAATLGDPAGIAPEVLVKSIASGELDDLCDPILFGDTATVERACKVCGVIAPVRSYKSLDAVKHQLGTINVVDTGALKPNSYVVGHRRKRRVTLCWPGSIRRPHFARGAQSMRWCGDR